MTHSKASCAARLSLILVILLVPCFIIGLSTSNYPPTTLHRRNQTIVERQDDDEYVMTIPVSADALGPLGGTSSAGQVVVHDIVLPTIDESYGRLERMWSCSAPKQQAPVSSGDQVRRNTHKLVFAHIDKTAGSTLRTLLQMYGAVCNASIALVVECTALSFESLQGGAGTTATTTTTWRNAGDGQRAGRPCTLKTARNRRQENLLLLTSAENNNNTLDTAFLENNDIDILGGHLPLGSDYGWKDKHGTQVDVQYLVFFRDGVHKFISSVIYLKSDMTTDELVKLIKQRVKSARRQGKYYERYTSYLITPQQRYSLAEKNISLSMHYRVNLTLHNLIQYNVIIGIVERMSESLEVLQYVMDSQNELQAMFQEFGMNSTSQSAVVMNPSRRVPTSVVLQELEKDELFMQELREYVKYEDLIRTFALDLHIRQHQYVQAQNEKEFS